MSQRALGEALGVSYQQVQKYERGANRIAVVTLVRAADALGAPLTYFLAGLRPGATVSSYSEISADTLDGIQDRKLRTALRTLVRALASRER